MAVLVIVLLIVVVFFILGAFLIKFLLWVAIVAGLLWLIGFFLRGADGARWYRW